uniref:Secreted protein n=1 Tax=Cacopsylla melanoneura TaxID=428564 RepID=A0A8D9B920_9HEMI
MSVLSSTTLLVTLAFACIFLQPSIVSSDTAEQPDLLPAKALDVCKENNTKVCPKGSPDKEPVCEGYDAKAGGTDSRCDADNGCFFNLQINGQDKLVYVSHEKKISDAVENSITYKKCDENKLIIYSLYAASK